MIMSYMFINVCMCAPMNICHVWGCSHSMPCACEQQKIILGPLELALQTAGRGHLGTNAGCSIREPSLQPPLMFVLILSLVLDYYY